jgi:formylglycine-generating enzyme required for sulfatase activity
MKSLLLAMLFSLLMVGCGEEAKKEAVQKDEAKDDNAALLGENFTVPDLNLSMIWVKPGTFTMGSPTSETGLGFFETQHQVTLTDGFYLGKYEVTQAQWERVMGSNPSYFKGADKPAEQVSWNDAVDFCNKLTEMEKNAGRVPHGMSYQLPTEAQWEYACRAGTTTKYSWGNDIDPKLANYRDSGLSKTRAVGSYRTNPWGFYDMHGNVGEWCADGYGKYPTGSVTDPIGLESISPSQRRVTRGGSWDNYGPNLRSAKRYNSAPYYSGLSIGFRVGFQSSK